MIAQAKPFTFETSFDPPTREEIEAAKQAELERKRQEEERLRALETKEEAPSFSEEELAAAKQEGYDQGRQDAVREMEVHAEQILAVTQQSVASKLEQIFKIQEQAAHIAERNTVELANVIVRKLFPSLESEHTLPEVLATVRNALDQFREEPSVSIRAHPDYEDALTKATDEMASRGIFKGTVHIIGDPEVSPGDCRIEWDGGGAERNMSRLFEEIDGIVKKTLDMMDQFDGPYETIPRPDPTPPPQQPEKPAKVADSEPVDADDNIDLFGDDEATDQSIEADANIDLFDDDDSANEPIDADDKIELFDDESGDESPEAPTGSGMEMEATDTSAEDEIAEITQSPATDPADDEQEPERDAAEQEPSGANNG